MKLQYILNSIPLLDHQQKHALCKIKNKSGFLLLAVLFINSASTIETEDINNSPSLQYTLRADYHCLVEPGTEANCARYINLATAPTQRAFDYDPDMLPEVAEVIFALRIRHANAGKPYIINLSGNYLLKFTKDRIHILDTYTKNSNVYEYQSTDPNITLGLSISKGLPRHYKGIIIKEDAHGKLYDYAALRSDNISTDETMLSETLSHPFYEIARQDGGEDQATISKAMAFYHELPSHSHSRHTRCVKESMGILEQIQEILGSGSLVCGPEAASGIRSANHQSAAEMTLDQPLVEAPVKTSKYPERLGYRLEERVDLNGENPFALLAAANFCKVSVKTILSGKRRQKRSPDSDDDFADCPYWSSLMIGLYMGLKLEFKDIYPIVESVRLTKNIPASFFPNGQYPRKAGAVRSLVRMILKHINRAAQVLQEGAAMFGEAAGASSFVDECSAECQAGSQSAVDECPAECQAGSQSAVTERGIEIYTLNGQQFIPEPNKVWIVDKINQRRFQSILLDDQQYTTSVIYSGDKEQRANMHVNDTISDYLKIVNNWTDKIKEKMKKKYNDKRMILKKSLNIANIIFLSLIDWKTSQNLVISSVYHNNTLIGISIGRIEERTYYPEYEIVIPESLFREDRSFRGQLSYLRSAVLEYLLSRGLIDKSELVKISKASTGHDEF